MHPTCSTVIMDVWLIMQHGDAAALLVFFFFLLPPRKLIFLVLLFSLSLSVSLLPQASSRKTISFVPIDPDCQRLCSQVWKGRLK